MIAVIVAIFVCPLVVNIPTQATVDPHAADTTHNNPATHVVHFRDMVLTTQENMSFTGAILSLALLLSSALVFIVSKKSIALTVNTKPVYQQHNSDFSYLAKKEIFSWPSLFERAPNFVTTA